MQKSIVFLYTSNEHSKNETRKTTAFKNTIKKSKIFRYKCTKTSIRLGDLQDGGGIRRGDQLPPHKYIRNTPTCGTTPTEHLLNAGRRPQTSQKARNSPCTWVGQKKKRKNRDKTIGTGPAPWGGSCEGGKVSTH